MKSAVSWSVVVAISLAFVSSAFAHVTVWPRESQAGAYEKYVVRVPTEGKVATTSVELEIPAGATLISVAVPTGYTYELRKSGDTVTGIAWTMRINPGEFAEFALMVRNPKDGKALTWKAVQKFADGSNTEWNGPAGDKHPAPMTTLTASR
jgi:uncharacterized protein YcnI